MRACRDVLADWAEPLSAKLGRPVDQIRREGLSAADFSPDANVRIAFGEGSFAEFRLAFACLRPTGDAVAVFTEHCGYLEFALGEDMEVEDIRRVAHDQSESRAD